MSLNAAQFRIELENLGEEVTDQAVLEVTKAVALRGLSGVVLKSPVDTGRFRANWNVAVESIDYSVSEATDKSGGATISKGTATINAVEPYRVIWLTNNLPYAERLEGGHSKQAPAGMVALTAAELESMFR